jgi:hypothetical protein
VAALGGTLVYTLTHWTTLVNALLPDRNVWQKSIISGILIASGLWLLGASIHSNHWTPIAILPLTLIPWATKLWRVILHKDVFDSRKEKITSLYLLIACALIAFPELAMHVIQYVLNAQVSKSNPASTLGESSYPRLLSLLSTLSIAAASSLMTTQQRKISGLIYWSIPCAVAAVVLSLFGWAAIQIFDNKLIVNALVETTLPSRASHAAPAIIFGITFLALRPRIQIHNSLRIGKVKSLWWQQLGLLCGFSICLLVSNQGQVNWYDFITTLLLIVGLSFESRFLPTQLITYAPLSVVEHSETPHAASGA